MVQAMLLTPDRRWTRRKKKNLADGYNAVVPTYLGFCNFSYMWQQLSKNIKWKIPEINSL